VPAWQGHRYRQQVIAVVTKVATRRRGQLPLHTTGGALRALIRSPAAARSRPTAYPPPATPLEQRCSVRRCAWLPARRAGFAFHAKEWRALSARAHEELLGTSRCRRSAGLAGSALPSGSPPATSRAIFECVGRLAAPRVTHGAGGCSSRRAVGSRRPFRRGGSARRSPLVKARCASARPAPRS
jgi:hypothetical protein